MSNLSSFLTIIVLINIKLLVTADKGAASSSSEKNVAFDVIRVNNNIEAPPSHKIDKHKNRPRADQKSLLIIFDGTGSMHDDLQQLTQGAQEIINDLSSRNDSPIFNYVLVVFRDPSKC